MSSIRRYSSVTLLVASAILSACRDSTGPAPVTVQSVFAELQDAQESLGSARGSIASFTFVGVPIVPFAAVPSTATCPFDASGQRFVCASSTRDGVTTSLYYQLLDASSHPQSAFDPATTAAIRTVHDVSGTVTSHDGKTDITGHGDHTLSGLLTGVHTLNGTSTTNVQTSFTFGTETFESSVKLTETTTNLILPRQGSGQRYPQRGSVQMDMTSTGGSAFDAHFTITFDGSSTATVVISTAGSTQTCKVDLTGKKEAQCTG